MHITLGFLNEVRCDILKNETPKTLEQRLIRTSVVEKFEELQSLGHSPVCLFHTRKACRLSAETIEIPCIEELDETVGTCKWNQKGSRTARAAKPRL